MCVGGPLRRAWGWGCWKLGEPTEERRVQRACRESRGLGVLEQSLTGPVASHAEQRGSGGPASAIPGTLRGPSGAHSGTPCRPRTPPQGPGQGASPWRTPPTPTLALRTGTCSVGPLSAPRCPEHRLDSPPAPSLGPSGQLVGEKLFLAPLDRPGTLPPLRSSAPLPPSQRPGGLGVSPAPPPRTPRGHDRRPSSLSFSVPGRSQGLDTGLWKEGGLRGRGLLRGAFRPVGFPEGGTWCSRPQDPLLCPLSPPPPRALP